MGPRGRGRGREGIESAPPAPSRLVALGTPAFQTTNQGQIKPHVPGRNLLGAEWCPQSDGTLFGNPVSVDAVNMRPQQRRAARVLIERQGTHKGRE